MKVDISPCTAPDGTRAVLFQADEFHVILRPHDALATAASLIDTANDILREGTTK